MRYRYRSTYATLLLMACFVAGVSAAPPNPSPAPGTAKPLPGTSQKNVAAPAIPPAMLTRVKSIRPGMTRADLAKLFTAEGGIHVGGDEQGSYVYRFGHARVPGRLAAGRPGSPSVPVVFGLQVKIDVTFVPAHGGTGGTAIEDGTGRRFPYLVGRQDDLITTVSQPYTGFPNDN